MLQERKNPANVSVNKSPDPFTQDPGNLQGYNRYSYVLNNPMKYVDPSGYTYAEFMMQNNSYEGGNFYYRGREYFYDSGSGGFYGHGGEYLGEAGYYYDYESRSYMHNGNPVSEGEVHYNYILPNASVPIWNDGSDEFRSFAQDLVTAITNPGVVSIEGSFNAYYFNTQDYSNYFYAHNPPYSDFMEFLASVFYHSFFTDVEAPDGKKFTTVKNEITPYAAVSVGKQTKESLLNMKYMSFYGSLMFTPDALYFTGGADFSQSRPWLKGPFNLSFSLSAGWIIGPSSGIEGLGMEYSAGSIFGFERGYSLNKDYSIGGTNSYGITLGHQYIYGSFSGSRTWKLLDY